MSISPIAYTIKHTNTQNPQKKEDIIVNMYSLGYPIETIAKTSDCSIENIENIIEKQINANAIKENRKITREEIIRKYNLGQNSRQIGYPESVIQDIVKEKMNENSQRIKIIHAIKRTGLIPKEHETEIKKRYLSGYTIGEISQYYNCDPRIIARIIRKEDN